MLFVIALAIGVGLAALVVWLRSRNIAMPWYTILIGVIGLLLLVFTIQNYFGAGLEGESDVAGNFLIYMGIPAVILIGVAGALVWTRRGNES